jgi:hypothetical protein
MATTDPRMDEVDRVLAKTPKTFGVDLPNGPNVLITALCPTCKTPTVQADRVGVTLYGECTSCNGTGSRMISHERAHAHRPAPAAPFPASADDVEN